MSKKNIKKIEPEFTLTGKDILESFEKVESCDIILSINREVAGKRPFKFTVKKLKIN